MLYFLLNIYLKSSKIQELNRNLKVLFSAIILSNLILYFTEFGGEKDYKYN